MASSEDRVPLDGSDRGLSPTGFKYVKLSTVLTQPFIEQLALCLDRGMRLIPNWKHLAWEMNVDETVIKQLEQFSDFSPTIRLFEHLEVTQPDLVIEQLRKALFEIGRNDLLNLLTTKAGCTDSEKVKEVITSPDIKAAPLRIGLLDEIALALDSTSRVTGNWQKLATKLGVPREAYLELGRRSTQNPTYQLFQYLAASRPQMTLKILKEALHFIARNDLFNNLQNLNDESLVKDVITPGSPLLQTMTVELNRKDVPGVKNWTHLASRLEVPNDVLLEFQEDSTTRKSPTKEVIQWLTGRFPDTTLIDLVEGLRKIQRNDAIQIITKQFPDAIDSSLERLCSSLNDNLKVDLPKDSMGVSFPSQYKKEERGSPYEQIAEKKQQSCYSGGLPDRTDLVGRQDTCELYIDTLTSNKAVEIVAPPGYGKTSVVVEVGHRMIEKGKRVAYVNPRGVTCVEDLGGRIIEALGVVPSEDTIQETFRRISALESKSLLLIIENIDNLLHIEDKVSMEKSCDEKMKGKYKKDDFLTFLKDMGRCPTIHLALTSREAYDFSICFPIKLFKLQPLSDEDSAHLFRTRDSLIDEGLVKDLVTICGGIPLLICTVLSILQRENPQTLTRRLSTCSSSELLDALSPNYIPNEDRINHCLQVCFDRLKEENQDVLVKISTFPHRFTREQFLAIFQSNLDCNLQTCFDCLKHSCLLRFDGVSSLFSLHPFIRKFFSAKTQYPDAKWAFTRHYSDLALTLCEQFLSQNSKSAIERYRNEKENIREAMTWCGYDHPELHQTTREHCIRCFNNSAVFLAKMMRKQEFESLFRELSFRCRNNLQLYSACLTNIGIKIVLSCMCTPCICPRALYRAKDFLSRANEIQSSLTVFDDATRAHCLSKLGFCNVREGNFDDGYLLLNEAIKLRKERTKNSTKNQDKVMWAACLNDVAASLTLERKHMAAIQTRTQLVLPVYESILGDHPFVATTLSWIAFSYQALGDYENAIKCTQRALGIRQQLLGDHKETARSFYDLGVALSAKQDYDSALRHLEDAVKLQIKVLDTPEELIITHQAMADVLRGLGREEDAEKEMERAAKWVKRLGPLDVPFDALESLKKAVSLQEEVLDTHDELIHTHQAMSDVLKALGREEEAEWEMEQAWECAKRLDSLEVSMEILQTGEEMRWSVSDVPIRSRQTGLKTQNRLSVKQNSDTLERKQKAEREIEPAGKSAKSLDYSKGPLEKFETCEEKEWEVSDLASISSKQAELRTQYRLSVKQISDSSRREEEAERKMELAGDSAKSLDSLEVPLEIFETREEKGWMVSDPAPISSRQAVDERVVRNETTKFEAEHEECVRVLPYQLKNGDVEIHLYVYRDKSGIPTKLKKVAQAFFGQYGWKLKWEDLYNDAFNVLQVTSMEYSSGQPKRLEASQVDEIEETINKHLHIFSNHRNVTAVQPFFKVTKSIQTEEACIVVYVLGKGKIPMGEKAIPSAIGPYRVDIVNGFCVRTNDPYMPIEAHKQKDFLRLGASIGVYGKQSSGTLGAIVEDEKSGTLYALSCHHVMHDADESRIIHPGFDVYLNCLRFNLNGYKAWIERITGIDLQLPASSDEAELQKMFDELKTKKEMHVDLEGCSNSAKEQITIFEKNLEEAFGKRPRVIASYSAGVRRNVRSDMSGRDHFIDAAISELDENEVKNVKAEKFLQIIDTTHYPSGKCISATTNETMNVEEVFKSGSATGFTESSLILGSSQSLPTFIKDFRQNGDFAWIDVDCINCKNRRRAQTQVQEGPDPCEQCQEHSGWLKSCLCIQQHGTKPFSDKGDSGAVIFEKLRKENRKYQLSSDGFGIIFAELPTQIGIFAIASPLETALKALSQKVSESRPDSEPCQLRLASSFR